MRAALILRTLILVAWLTALLWHGGLSASALALTFALAGVWVAAFVRDGRRARTGQPAVTMPAAAPAVRSA